LRASLSLLIVVCLAGSLVAKNKPKNQDSLASYLGRLQTTTPAHEEHRSLGSLFAPGGSLTDSGSDNIARSVNDAVVIRIFDETIAEATGAVATARNYSANSAIPTLPGKLNTGGINPLLGLNSEEKLTGGGQATSSSKLRAILTGRVVAVLPGGSLVVEATRSILMNNEKQKVTLRGVVRPVDIAPDNSVASTRLSDLEIEINGKGIVSDSTRRPHWLVRLLTKVLTF
jgi:flagellar L-ring protein FlgH